MLRARDCRNAIPNSTVSWVLSVCGGFGVWHRACLAAPGRIGLGQVPTKIKRGRVPSTIRALHTARTEEGMQLHRLVLCINFLYRIRELDFLLSWHSALFFLSFFIVSLAFVRGDEKKSTLHVHLVTRRRLDLEVCCGSILPRTEVSTHQYPVTLGRQLP